ncbi:MAG: DUF4398 domain-containing protein [Deltaproteobacteria bacterium]|nr:DUF4398 domain-containing protein [Deltaproteobacteria bacterium]
MIINLLRVVCFATLLLLSACGAIQYTTQMQNAERTFREARAEKAHERAAYEYFYAKTYLNQARKEAARSSYENAIRYAETAEKHFAIALKVARQRRAEKGQ